MVIFQSYFYQFFLDFIVTSYFLFYGLIFLKPKLKNKYYLISFMAHMLFQLINRRFFFGGAIYCPITYLGFFLLCLYAWMPNTILPFLAHFVMALSLMNASTFSAANALIAFLAPEHVFYYPNGLPNASLAYPNMYFYVFLSTVLGYCFGLLACIVVNKLYTKFKSYLSKWIHIIRPTILSASILAAAIIVYRVFDKAYYFLKPEPFKQVFLFQIVVGIASFFVVSYIMQDVRQWTLETANHTLAQQNEAYQAVITDQRIYLHNIANMIYGLHGIILSKDIESIENYYIQMAKRCSLLNNESIIEINKLSNPYITSILLNKLEIANSKEIPHVIKP